MLFFLQMKLRQQLQSIDSDQTIDFVEKSKRKQNLLMLHSLTFSTSTTPSPVANQQPSVSTMSPLAPAFYPPGDTVGSVVGHALDDLNLDDIDINSIDRELDKDEVNSLSSSLSAGIPTSGFGAQSIPIGIPGGIQRGSIGSLSQSPPSPFGSFSHSLLTGNQKHESGEQNLSLLGYHNHNKFSDLNSMSPRSGPGGPHSPLYSSSNLSNSSQGADMQKLREEFQHYKTRQEHWEQAYSQAKSACEAWKREAEESLRKAKSAEEEKAQAFKQRDEALGRISKMQLDLEKYGGGSNSVRLLHQVNEIETIPIPQLRQIQQQLRMDVDKLEKVIVYQQNMKCIMCQDRKRTVTCSPCNHRVLCDTCVSKSTDCPMCHVQRTNYRL